MELAEKVHLLFMAFFGAKLVNEILSMGEYNLDK